jgi:hypothetical protein
MDETYLVLMTGQFDGSNVEPPQRSTFVGRSGGSMKKVHALTDSP